MQIKIRKAKRKIKIKITIWNDQMIPFNNIPIFSVAINIVTKQQRPNIDDNMVEKNENTENNNQLLIDLMTMLASIK